MRIRRVTKTLDDISTIMRDVDFAMLSTRSEGGQIGARPMSNNRQVDYDGDSHYFALDDTRSVTDIARDPAVGLAFQAKSGLLGLRPVFLAVEGHAELIRDRARFAEHWTTDLDRWFERGIDTPGLVLIEIHAVRVHYWDGEDEGEVAL